MNARRMHVMVVCVACTLLLGLFLGLRAVHSQGAPPAVDSSTTTPAVVAASEVWVVDSYATFAQGVPGNVALHQPGSATLDWSWWPDGRVNAATPQSKLAPRTTWVLSTTGGVTQTLWLTVWADERQADHSPDIFVAQSVNGGRTWLPDILIDDACDPDYAPYPDCPAHFTPDITARVQDGSLWVVWQQEETDGDAGNIYYAASGDIGATWPVKGAITNAAGKQHWPRVANSSATLYTIWESERSDAGDILIARYNPDTDGAWSAPVTVSDDTTGAEQSQAALAADAAGNLYAVWTDTRSDDDGAVYFSHWLSGTTWADGSWSAAVQLSATDVDWGVEPDIKASPDGSIYAAWMERVPTGPATYDFQIVVAHSTDQGATWTKTVVNRLHNASATNASYQAPSLGVMNPGRILVAWLHSPDAQAATSDILVAVSFDRGAHWSLPRRLNAASTVSVDSFPAVATDGVGGAVVAWQDYRLGASTHIFAAGYPADRYALRGSYLAAALPGGAVMWDTLVWTATVPANTGLSLSTRVYVDTATGWSDWITHTVSPVTLTHGEGEILQVRANFMSDGFGTPTLDGIQATYESSLELFLPVLMRSD